MPHVIIVCVILAVASQAQGFIDPTLEPHMRKVMFILDYVVINSFILQSVFVCVFKMIFHVFNHLVIYFLLVV